MKAMFDYKKIIPSLVYLLSLISANAENVTINGLNYYLDIEKHDAIIDRDNTWSGELDIPSEVIYEGQRFVVKSMIWCAFANCPELTRVRIPKTIESVTHHVLNGMNGAVSPDHMNPFMGCIALESVEVDEENPSFKSVDGVFFSQDGKGQYYIGLDYFNGTGLYCYPAGKPQESYIIPEGVEWIGATAFEYSQHLTTLTIPSTMICIYGFAFKGCSNLTDVYCNAENVPKTNKQAFTDCPLASATLHVPAGSVDLYKSTYPWSEFGNIVALTTPVNSTIKDEFTVSSQSYDLQGRRLSGKPARGIYIENGKKTVR